MFSLCLLIIISSCKKDKNDLIDDTPLPQNIDPFVPEFEAWISTMPDVNITLEELVLDNGINVYDFLTQHDPQFLDNLGSGRYAPNTQKTNLSEEMQYNLFISRMVAVGNNLVSTTAHVKPAGANATLEPAQSKLVYSFGSKNHIIRAFPTTGGCKEEHKIFGLDCSGMVHQMISQSGLTQVEAPGMFSCQNVLDVNKWNAGFAVSDEFPDLMVIDMGNLSPKKRKSGDIIFFRKAKNPTSFHHHIGITLKNNVDNKNYVYQSNGNPDGCSANMSKGPSLKNIDYTHGVGYNTVYRIVKRSEILSDVDGNFYQTVQIGNQRWFQEDLRTTKFRDGTPIPNIKDPIQWIANNQPAFATYENEEFNDKVFGLLYNYYAVASNKGLCPLEYHVATDEDWKTLEFTLGMEGDELDMTGYRGQGLNIGNQLKFEAEWMESGSTTANSSAFNGLPNGGRSGFDGIFGGRYTTAFWWTGTETTISNEAYYRELFFNNSGINRNVYSKEHGFSVRCVKD
jgi:uncharacterized protein (TIGR02145 family)